MRIGIDMDGVVSDFGTEWKVILEGMFGPAEGRTPPVHFDDDSTGYSLSQVHSARDFFLNKRNAWTHLKPLPEFDAEAQSLLRDLCTRHDVYFITNRFITPGSSPVKQTAYWLYVNAYVITPQVLVTKKKAPVAEAIQLDLFIDDSPKNCLDVLEARPTAKVYLADSSHNQDFNDPRIPRVKDLKEFLKLILEAN